MASVPEEKIRSQSARPGADGKPTFSWTLTNTSLLDTVRLTLPSTHSLPIIFVPGIMGSNLCRSDGEPVWLLNGIKGKPVKLAWYWLGKGANIRQKTLHPSRTRVYSGGNVPSTDDGLSMTPSEYLERGWGEIAETSYHAFLIWLQQKMNNGGSNPANWHDFFYTSISATPKPGDPIPEKKLFPGISMTMPGLPLIAEGNYVTEPVFSDDLLKRAKWRFPVYACGYNWLASNAAAAKLLAARIDKVIAENNRGIYKCEQVILVTHSMGGLVARACVDLPGVAGKVAGVLHGVMPAVGAAVAYRRCKSGMRDEDFGSSIVIGPTGAEVTAVFAQAPGALQLLPSADYGTDWLQIKDQSGKTLISLPKSDPYKEIYLCKDKWWGLIKQDWLKPTQGAPIDWEEFESNIMLAQGFHERIAGKFHANTYVFYGASGDEQASFEKITWTLKNGFGSNEARYTSPSQATALNYEAVRVDGSAVIYVGGETIHQSFPTAIPGYVQHVSFEKSDWEIKCQMQDSIGDGTVPAKSGAVPRLSGGKSIRQQFRLKGFGHEPAYQDPVARCVSHYCLTKIAVLAKVIK